MTFLPHSLRDDLVSSWLLTGLRPFAQLVPYTLCKNGQKRVRNICLPTLIVMLPRVGQGKRTRDSNPVAMNTPCPSRSRSDTGGNGWLWDWLDVTLTALPMSPWCLSLPVAFFCTIFCLLCISCPLFYRGLLPTPQMLTTYYHWWQTHLHIMTKGIPSGSPAFSLRQMNCPIMTWFCPF